MTTPTQHSGVHPWPAMAPVDLPRTAGQRRWRAWHVAAAAAVMVAGALASGVLVAVAQGTSQYLAVAQHVPYGAQVTGDDLAAVRVGSPPGLDPVPATDLDRVVGLYAAVPMVPGTLLAVGMLTAEPIPGPDEHVVGVTLRADRMPAHRPVPGDIVVLVATGQAATGEPSETTWLARVTALDTGSDGLFSPARGGVVTLDVVVPAEQGPAIARAAAAGELVVVRTGQG